MLYAADEHFSFIIQYILVFVSEPITEHEHFSQWFLQIVGSHECKPVEVPVCRLKAFDILKKLMVKFFNLILGHFSFVYFKLQVFVDSYQLLFLCKQSVI